MVWLCSLKLFELSTWLLHVRLVRLCVLSGCSLQVERRGLEAHLSECNFRSRECPNGCGHTLFSIDQSQHNCVAELRTEVEMLRCVCVCVKIESNQNVC